MATIVVEYLHDPPLPVDEAGNPRLHDCLEVRGVTWKETFVSSDRRHQFCVFDAPDAQTVRDAFRSAEVTFVRAWSGDWLR